MAAPKRYVEEPKREFKRVFMDDKPFAEALGAFIVACTDFVPVNRSSRTIFLARRKIQAAKGIWRFGGRQLPGETMQGSCARLAKRELKLSISIERFAWFLQTEEMFSFRAQIPVDAGVHDLINLFAVEFTDKELAHARQNLDPMEYDQAFGIQEFGFDDLRLEMAGGCLRPQILDMYCALFPK